tara:strand:- start:8145 stop:8393 length:249 start_codon:yes stop_codon:yes gene_type:complete
VDVYLKKIQKATNDLSSKLTKFNDIAPVVQEKLLAVEKQSSEEDGLNYSDTEIEEIVDVQMKNHPLTTELEKAIADFEEVFE